MSSIYPSFGNAPVQLCQRCGRPLPPNEVYCGNCGLVNSPAQINNAPLQPPSGLFRNGQPQQGPFNPGQSSGQQWGQTPSNNPFSTNSGPQQVFGTNSGPQQIFSAPNQFPLTAPQQSPANVQNGYGSQASQPAFYPQSPTQQPFTVSNGMQQGNINTLQPNAYPQNGYLYANAFTQQQQQPPLNAYQPDSFAKPPEEPKRSRKMGLIITSVVLLLLILGGVIGGYLYLKKNSATTSVQTTPTAVPTAQPKGAPIFSDSFINNNAGWDLTGKPGQFSVKIGNGSMDLEDDNNKLFFELIPGNKNFSDFYLTVDATLSKGSQNNGYGIYIRGASNQTFDIATYYRFELYGDGTFAIFKGSVNASGTSKSTILVNYTVSPAIMKQGQVNHIAISAKGSALAFYVNGQTLKIVNDNTYTSGSIAFFVSNLPNTTPGARASFSKLVVYPPQP